MERPQPVTIAGRYELREELGAGTSGVVYRAFDGRLGREVAIKLMKEALQGDAMRRFVREARVASQFQHSDTIGVFDVGEIDGRPFLVMELVTSPNLAAAILAAPDPPSIAIVVEIGALIATMLAAAHEAGLVHRDLKPANVFVEGPLEAPERCRLADFGLAFMLEPTTETVGRFTMEGVMLGTPLYMAPEQISGAEVGRPADVYSLGCIIHEMISGRPPFVGNLGRIMAGHLYLPPIALRELDQDVPIALEQLVLEMLDKSPAARPAARDIPRRLRDLQGATKRQRSTTLQPRHARAVAPHQVDEAPQVDDPPVVAIELDAPALVASLRVERIAMATTAPLVIVAFEALQQTTDGRRRLALHPAPTAKEISMAIRLGAVGIVRWPGAITAVVTQIHKSWRRIRSAGKQ